jgi:hypothetical protein
MFLRLLLLPSLQMTFFLSSPAKRPMKFHTLLFRRPRSVDGQKAARTRHKPRRKQNNEWLDLAEVVVLREGVHLLCRVLPNSMVMVSGTTLLQNQMSPTRMKRNKRAYHGCFVTCTMRLLTETLGCRPK